MKDYTAFLEKSNENIKAAKALLDLEFYNTSASHVYYAAFQVALALLLKFGIDIDASSHKRLQATFSLELIHKRKIIDSKFKSHLIILLERRIIADYYDNTISSRKANIQYSESENLIKEIIARIQC